MRLHGKSIAKILMMDVQLFAECGVVETAQAVLLGAATLLCLLRASIPGWEGSRLPFAFLALFFVTLLLREVDVQDYPLPSLLVGLGSGAGRNTWLGLAWAISIIYSWMRWRAVHPLIRNFFLRTWAGWAVLAGLAFYAAGLPFDRGWFGIATTMSLAIEETLELVACAVFLLGACLLVRKGGFYGPMKAPRIGRGGW